MKNVILVLTIALMAGCAAPNQDTTEAAKAGIEAGNAAYVAAANSGDAAAQAALHTSDAWVMAPNKSTVMGMDAIVEHMTAQADTTGMVVLALETVGVEGFGDVANEIGTYTVTAGGEEVDHGKYIAIWKNVDGTWKLHRDIWNSSVAKPMADTGSEEM